MPPHYQQSLQPVEVVDYLEEEEEEATRYDIWSLPNHNKQQRESCV